MRKILPSRVLPFARSLARSVIPFLNWPSNSPSAHSLTSPSPLESRITKSVGADPGEEIILYFPHPPSHGPRRNPINTFCLTFAFAFGLYVAREGRFFAAGDKRRRSLLASHSWRREICRTKHGEKLPPTRGDTLAHVLARSRRRELG